MMARKAVPRPGHVCRRPSSPGLLNYTLGSRRTQDHASPTSVRLRTGLCLTICMRKGPNPTAGSILCPHKLLFWGVSDLKTQAHEPSTLGQSGSLLVPPLQASVPQ